MLLYIICKFSLSNVFVNYNEILSTTVAVSHRYCNVEALGYLVLSSFLSLQQRVSLGRPLSLL